MQLKEVVEPLWRVTFVPEQLMQLFCSKLGWYDRLLHGTQGFRPVFEKVPGWQGSEKADKDCFSLNVKQHQRKCPVLKIDDDQLTMIKISENMHLNFQLVGISESTADFVIARLFILCRVRYLVYLFRNQIINEFKYTYV